MNKLAFSFFNICLLGIITLSSCVNTTSSGDDTVTDSISYTDIDDYEEWIDSWSQEGHLYIHYLRDGASEEEYNKYAIWIWQTSPIQSEGSLWGASNTDVQAMYRYMSTSWMKGYTPDGGDADQYGKIMDIDMTADVIGGRSGTSVPLLDSDTIGFLIVDQTTMGGSDHWTSDGGKNIYVYDFQSHFRANGSMHIFCVSGSVSEYSFTSEEIVEVENPTISDTTGNYASTSDVDSSSSNYGNSSTSASFQELGVGYQIFVASFRDSDGDGVGDIRGIIDSLDYLEDLGVQTLWLTPIQKSESYHGYDTIDYYQVDSKFGSNADYRELLFKCHERGMKVIMDLVLNHTSTNNIWFTLSQRAAKGTDEFGNTINYRDLYHWKYKGTMVQYYENGGYKEIPVEEHPDWYKDGESNYYYYGKFGSSMAELNYDCQAARELVKNLAQYWLAFGVDGFRLDAVKHIYMKDEVADTTGDLIVQDVGERTYYDTQLGKYVTTNFDYSSDITKNINFWKEFATDIKNIYPDCFLVGENFDGYGARIAPYYQALDSQFDFSLYYHNAEWLFQKKNGMNASYMSVTQPNETYNKYSSNGTTYIDGVGNVPMGNRPDFINSAFTSNHDVDRAINHVNSTDKITGTSKEINRAKVHAASTILSPGISWIYYGDELGMSGNTDQHIGLYENTNNEDLWYRQPFKWGDDGITVDYSFDMYSVEWDSYNKNLASANEQSTDDNSMLSLYKALTAVKKLYGGHATYKGYESSNSDILHFVIESDGGTFYIYINAGTGTFNYNLEGSNKVLLNGATETSLGAYGIAVGYDLA